MALHAAPALGRKDRHVRRSYLHIGAQTSRHRIAYTLEEALRLVDLPGEEEGRVYHFRRLDVQDIPADASRAHWIEHLQKALASQAQRAVHGTSPSSQTSDAVYFDHEDEAFEVILQAALQPNSRPAWFWPAVAGAPPGSQRAAYVPAILSRLREQRTPQHAAAIILSAVGTSDPAPLLSAISIFDLRDWMRDLETPGTFFADTPPMALPEGTAAAIEQAAHHFGWSDHRTLWLATQAVLSFSSPAQSTGLAVKKAQATLRNLEVIRSSRKPEWNETEPSPRPVAITPSPRPILFDDDHEPIFEPSTLQAKPAVIPEPSAEPQVTQPQPDVPRRPTPTLRGERTHAAGLYFLLHALRHLGITRALDACPALVEANFVAHIIHHLAAQAGVAPGDEILSAVGGVEPQTPFVLPSEIFSDMPNVWPLGFGVPSTFSGDDYGISSSEDRIYMSRLQRSEINSPRNLGLLHPSGQKRPPGTPIRPRLVWDGPSALRPERIRAKGGPAYLLRVWVLAVRRWCWQHGQITVRDIVTRPGRVWLTRTDLDVTLALSDADVRIRRLGLDIDPGWLPWFSGPGRFGLVIRFHYRDGLGGDDAC